MNPVKSIARRSVRFLASLRLLSPKMTAILLHRIQLGRWPDLHNPKDLNEKIMWLEFNTDTSPWSRLADKYEVRSYLQEKGLGRYLLPLYGVYDSVDEIDFEKLPDSFAIKSTNGCGQTILVRNKKDISLKSLRTTIARWARKNHGLSSAEPHYTHIPKRIIAEKLLPAPDGSASATPVDYKFMCYDGKPLYCLVCTNRETRHFHTLLTLFSIPLWEKIEGAVTPGQNEHKDIEKPDSLEEMISCAEMLSKGFPFVRVDLYNINGKVFFGEMTFTPAASRNDSFVPKYLHALGDPIKLPQPHGI